MQVHPVFRFQAAHSPGCFVGCFILWPVGMFCSMFFKSGTNSFEPWPRWTGTIKKPPSAKAMERAGGRLRPGPWFNQKALRAVLPLRVFLCFRVRPYGFDRGWSIACLKVRRIASAV
jgi:hypothetical protein